eukprot:366074-Chlamydomonas_euryale.AAC.11
MFCWSRALLTSDGEKPAAAQYRSSLPTGIPMPFTPRSPRPKMREPSVTTIADTLSCQRGCKKDG